EVSNPAIEVLARVQTHGDLLDQPPVAVRIAERGERRVTAPRLSGPLIRPSPGTRWNTSLTSTPHRRAQRVPPRCPTRRDRVLVPTPSRAKVDRARRARWRKLYDPKLVTTGQVGVEPPTQAAIKALGAIDVRNRDDDDLELHVDRSSSGGLDCRFAASTAHVELRWFVHLETDNTRPKA